MAERRHHVPALDKAHENPGHGHHEAKDSDFFPSVSLAAVLFLIFVFVLPVLFQTNKDHFPVRKPPNLLAKTVPFHPLLYSQPLATQLTLERLNKNKDEEITILVAAAGDAIQTLECFSTNLVSLLANRGQATLFTKRVREYKPPAATWSNNSNRFPAIFSVAAITRGKGEDPQGVILSLPSLITGNFHLTEIITPKSQLDEVSKSLSIATELLLHLYKTRNIPETFEVRNSINQCLGVLEIKGDPYLESGLVC